MFWRFGGYSSVSTIDAILDKQDFTLEDLLEEADLIQELKQHNTRLIEFLREDAQLEKLMRYVVAPKIEDEPKKPAGGDGTEVEKKKQEAEESKEKKGQEMEQNKMEQTEESEQDIRNNRADGSDPEPENSAPPKHPTLVFSRPRSISLASIPGDEEAPPDSPDQKRNRYAYVSSEILSSDTWSIVEAFMENAHLFSEFWAFLKRKGPLDPLQAGYFTKVNEALFDKKTEQMVEVLKGLDGAVADLLAHVESPMIMDLLLKIIALDRKDGGHGIVEWLYSQDIIPSLVSCLSPNRNWVVQTAAGDFLKAIITISANASQNDQQCIGPNELTRQLVSRPCVQQLIDYMLGGGNPLTVGVGIVIEVIRKNNSDYDPDVGSDVGTPPTSRDPIYLGTLLRLFAENVPEFMRLIMKAPCEGNAVGSTFGEKLEPLGFDRFKTCELMAELLHCSNMGLLNELGAEELIAARDAERHRLRAEGRLYPQYMGDDMSMPADDLTMRSLHHHEESRRLEVTNRDDDFEEVENSTEDFVRAEGDGLLLTSISASAGDSATASTGDGSGSFMDKDDDDFVDEPLSSPRLHIRGIDDEDANEVSQGDLPAIAVVAADDDDLSLSFKEGSMGEISMMDTGEDEETSASVEEKEIAERLGEMSLHGDDIDDDKEVEQVEQVEDVADEDKKEVKEVKVAEKEEKTVTSKKPVVEAGTTATSSTVEAPASVETCVDPGVTVTAVSVDESVVANVQGQQVNISTVKELTTPDVFIDASTAAENAASDQTTATIKPDVLVEFKTKAVVEARTETEAESEVVPEVSIVSEADDAEISRESLETTTPEGSIIDMKNNTSQVSEPENSSAFSTGLGDSRLDASVLPEQLASHIGDSSAIERSDTPAALCPPAPVVGDLLKMQFAEYNVVPTILSFFFAYPWNNFLHNVVYDIVQQVFNGPMDRGFNPTLAISLFESADITTAIIRGQAASDESQARTKTRMGYMGHLTLIAEEVVKFTERHPPDLLSELVLDRVMSQEWVNYVDGPLAETRDRDNAILGGVRPEDAISQRANMSMDYGPDSISLSNTGSNALASAGLTGGSGLELGQDSGSGLGPFTISTGTLMSGFGSSSDEDDDDDETNDEDVANEFRAYTDPLNNSHDNGNPPSVLPPPPPPPPLNIAPSRARLQLQARLAMHQKQKEAEEAAPEDVEDAFGPSSSASGSSIPARNPFDDDADEVDDLSDDEASTAWTEDAGRGSWWREALKGGDDDGDDSDDLGDDEFGEFAVPEEPPKSPTGSPEGTTKVGVGILRPLAVHPGSKGLGSLWPFGGQGGFAVGSSPSSGSPGEAKQTDVEGEQGESDKIKVSTVDREDEVVVMGEDGGMVSRAREAKRRTSLEDGDDEVVV